MPLHQVFVPWIRTFLSPGLKIPAKKLTAPNFLGQQGDKDEKAEKIKYLFETSAVLRGGCFLARRRSFTQSRKLRYLMKKMVRLATEEDGGGNYIGIYDDSHLRFWALIALISALMSSSVSPSCAAVLCACSISE